MSKSRLSCLFFWYFWYMIFSLSRFPLNPFPTLLYMFSVQAGFGAATKYWTARLSRMRFYAPAIALPGSPLREVVPVHTRRARDLPPPPGISSIRIKKMVLTPGFSPFYSRSRGPRGGLGPEIISISTYPGRWLRGITENPVYYLI